jgi:citrate lyase subunit beta / citryl-CoA lyase
MVSGLRRSVLYVPCDCEKMIVKSASLPADVLILNLEDGVTAARKDEARAHAVRALSTLDFGDREVVVRINSLESQLGKRDLSEIVPCRPAGICLPKIETPAAIRGADETVRELERKVGMPEGSVRFHAMIESAAGVLSAREIAAASARMSSLIFGSADYCADVHCRPGSDRIELLLALQLIVTSARASLIDAIDSPCFDLVDSDLLRREATQARCFGFDGKSALHPRQLPEINEIFAVTSEEIGWAEKVMQELMRAEEKGRALSTLEGQLVDNPHRNAAERIMRRARLLRK